MRKLNRGEINAVADKIINNVNLMADQEQARLDKESDAKNKGKAEKLANELKGLSAGAKALLKKRLGKPAFKELTDPKLMVKSFRQTQTKIARMYTWGSPKNEVVETLIFEQIECADLNELINNVTDKFTKQK